jgi:ribosomal protein S12 methylthiotransferase accessory factor
MTDHRGWLGPEFGLDGHTHPVALLPSSEPPLVVGEVELQGRKVPGHAGERSLSADDVLARVRPYFGEAGISRLANITGLDDLGIPVTLAVRPNGRVLSNSAGKGVTLDAALASAAMEALELYHAEDFTVPTKWMSYLDAFVELDAPRPAQLPLASWAPFDVERQYEWVEGADLSSGRAVALPAGMVRMGDRQGRRRDLYAFQVTSNGLASGTCLAEAVHSGLLEVIERDAVTCWDHRRFLTGDVPPVASVEEFGSEDLSSIARRLADGKTELLLFDCTVDTLVPVFMAFVYSTSDRARPVCKGYGASLDPATAAIRAASEAVQARTVMIAGSRDDIHRHRFANVDWGVTIDHLKGMAVSSSRRNSWGSLASTCATGVTFEGEIRLMMRLLSAAGLDRIVVVDLSKPTVPISVVKVVVVGTEGITAENYVPGARANAWAEAERVTWPA